MPLNKSDHSIISNDKYDSFSCISAFGPFWKDLNDFSTLNKIFDQIKSLNPEFCILGGPFIDSNNFDKNSTSSPNTIMQNIIQEIENFAKQTQTVFFLLPSTRDVAALPCFPQHGLIIDQNFSKSSSKTQNLVNLCQNPSIISLESFKVAICSEDALLGFVGAELTSADVTSSRMKRFVDEITSQKW